jgi:hypothetical protein
MDVFINNSIHNENVPDTAYEFRLIQDIHIILSILIAQKEGNAPLIIPLQPLFGSIVQRWECRVERQKLLEHVFIQSSERLQQRYEHDISKRHYSGSAFRLRRLNL